MPHIEAFGQIAREESRMKRTDNYHRFVDPDRNHCHTSFKRPIAAHDKGEIIVGRDGTRTVLTI
jgi:hypothetical protein